MPQVMLDVFYSYILDFTVLPSSQVGTTARPDRPARRLLPSGPVCVRMATSMQGAHPRTPPSLPQVFAVVARSDARHTPLSEAYGADLRCYRPPIAFQRHTPALQPASQPALLAEKGK